MVQFSIGLSIIFDFHHTTAHSSCSIHIKMKGYSDIWFKQYVIKFLTVENVPPIEIHRQMNVVCGDQRTDMSAARHWLSKAVQRWRNDADLDDKPYDCK